jgi:outer membrane lipoprotein carrier protein
MRTARIHLLGSILLAGSTFAQSSDVAKVADAVDRHYNNLASFKTEFTETYSGNGLSRKESGTLWLKKPGKMLWSYTTPSQKVFLSDGKTAYFYVPGEQQARRSPIKNLDDLRSPLRYLLGNTKLQREFSNLQVASAQNGTVTLDGVPKGMQDRVQSVRLSIQADQITGIRIEQLDGSVTEFHFRNTQDNAPIADAKFRPSVPAGVHWIETEDLSPE